MLWKPFIQTLEQELAGQPLPRTKHLIRFKSMKDYHACKRQIVQSIASPKVKQALTFLPSVRSIACPLKSKLPLLHHPGIASIDNDELIKLSFESSALTAPSYIKPKLAHPIPWGIRRINAPRIWKYALGEGVRIGVIDTGVDFQHPDLQKCLGSGINVIRQSTLPYDDNGHGTHIAGTIAAHNRQGMLGIAPKATLYPVKAFDHQGSAYISDIILGIEWCIRQNVDIINMSFGMKQRNQALYEAVRHAQKAGIIVVASSGNDGKGKGIDFPARFTQTIGVGAVDHKNKIAVFSNRGKNLDLYAPGDRIVSTWPGGQYAQLSGTSMATSHVTGIIALLLSRHPKIRPVSLKVHLKRTSRKIIRKSAKAKKKEWIGLIDAIQTFKPLIYKIKLYRK